MSRKKTAETKTAHRVADLSEIAYKSKKDGCYHAGVYYSPGEILPEMPLHCLNVHIGGGNVEMVEVAPDEIPAIPEPTPETVIEVIDQIIEDDYVATL